MRVEKLRRVEGGKCPGWRAGQSRSSTAHNVPSCTHLVQRGPPTSIRTGTSSSSSVRATRLAQVESTLHLRRLVVAGSLEDAGDAGGEGRAERGGESRGNEGSGRGTGRCDGELVLSVLVVERDLWIHGKSQKRKQPSSSSSFPVLLRTIHSSLPFAALEA